MAGLREKLISACIEVVEEIRAEFVPNPKTRYKTSTGNMAFNALRYKIEGNLFTVYVDEQIAPYVWYTIKPWLSPRWHGKKNPNQDWDKIFQEEFMRRLAEKLGGKIE